MLSFCFPVLCFGACVGVLCCFQDIFGACMRLWGVRLRSFWVLISDVLAVLRMFWFLARFTLCRVLFLSLLYFISHTNTLGIISLQCKKCL
jgi:hypothetical protein